MARATKTKQAAKGAAAPAAAPSPKSTGRLAGKVVECALNHRTGRWVVAEDEGGKFVRLARPAANLSTWVDRASLTVVS